MEYFDIVDEHGNPTGQTVERKQAHRNNILHRTAHVWIVRRRENSIQILLQKRCMEKDFADMGCHMIETPVDRRGINPKLYGRGYAIGDMGHTDYVLVADDIVAVEEK